jgi:ABC-type phosphate/phosphonate transport system substrate-binding protein
MAKDEQGKAPADIDAELAPTVKVERAPHDESKTLVDGASPVHRGVLPTDFTGPSYSELRRKAHEAGDADSRLALPIGFVLNEYVIERVLGIGGFGISYLAQDTNLNTKVAIKEYLPNDLALRSDAEPTVTPRGQDYVEDYKAGLMRFLQECRTLATFRHAHIVRVNRFFEAHNTAYMVMDYEYGESLGAWVKKRQERAEGAPDETMLLRMFSPLLDGLDVVHQGGFMHRDVKPANIYVRDTDGSLVLLDFGAAREAVAQGQRALTSIVTPGYAPFEQYHSHGRQGPWSDIYAMGGVLYWIVTGKKPVEAAARVTSDPQEPAAQCAKGRYSERFLQAIDWALNPDDLKRPQTVAQFKQALTGTAVHLAAGGDSEAGKRGLAAGRRRTFITIAAGGTALALASAAVGVAVMKWGKGGGATLRMAVVPSSSGATEDIQIKAALSPMVDILKKATGRDVSLTVVQSVAPQEGAAPYDLILGSTFTIGAAARDLQYAVVGKFRDAVALFVARNGVPMDRFEDMKGARLGLHAREGMTGPMAARALESNKLPLAASFASITEIKGQEDNLVQALIDDKVDVVALSPGGYAEAEKQFPNKIKLIATSDPLPGYGIALRHSLDAELSLKLTQTLWKFDDSPEGRAALKAINLGSAGGSLEIRQANSREYVRAAELIEAGRKLFPAAKP